MSESTKDRIKKLIKSKQLTLPSSIQSQEYRNSISNVSLPQSKLITENMLIGVICGGIVVAKDQQRKQLILHLIYMYDPVNGSENNISGNKYTAYLKDYELKADLSIFTYINSFKNIQLGAFINGMVRKIDKREQPPQNIFELYLNCPKNLHTKVGIIKDHIKIPNSILKVYEKQQTLPLNFQILYTQNYDNPGLINQILKKNHLLGVGSLHQISNIPEIRRFDIIIQRLIYIIKQNSLYSGKKVGKLTFSNKNQTALDCLKIAKKFDEDNIEIYIARGCTLVNMNNFADGLKDIKEALKIDPKNQKARQYYEKITQQMYANQQNQLVKRNYSSHETSKYSLIHKK